MEEQNITTVDLMTVSKVYISDIADPYYIIATWEDDTKIKLVHKNQYWTGILYAKNLSHFYEDLHMPSDKYLTNTKKALSTSHADNEYVFDFKNQELRWKIQKPSMAIIHGSVKMTELIPEGGNEMLIDTLLEINKISKSNLRNQENEAMELGLQLRKLIDKFDEYSKLKTDMEQDLYHKFIQILNAKKKHIENMEEFVNGQKQGAKIVVLDDANEVTRQLHSISDSESDRDEGV